MIAEDMKRAWAAQLEVLEEVKRVCGILGIKFLLTGELCLVQ